MMHMRFSAAWLIGWLAWGLGLGLGASPALGQRTGIELRPKWESAEPTRYRVDEEMIQEISGTNNTLLEWHRTMEYTERVIERDAEAGTVTVERMYDRVAVEVAGEGVEDASYDSADPRTADAKGNPLIGPFAALEGQAVRFTVDADGNVLEASGADTTWAGMLQSLAGGLGQGMAGALTGSTPSGDAMRQQIEDGLRQLPEGPVKVRDTWTQRLEHATPIGTVTSEIEHRLGRFQGRGERQLARITSTGTLTVGGGEAGGLGGMLQGLAGLSIELGETSVEGAALFDVGRGQFVRQELNIQTEWVTELGGGLGEGLDDLGTENRQRITQRSVLERLD